MLWIKNLVKSYNGLYIRLQSWTTNHHLRLQTPILFLNFAHLSSQLGCLYRKYQTKIVPRNTYHYTTCSAFAFNVYPKLIYLNSGSVFIKQIYKQFCVSHYFLVYKDQIICITKLIRTICWNSRVFKVYMFVVLWFSKQLWNVTLHHDDKIHEFT